LSDIGFASAGKKHGFCRLRGAALVRRKADRLLSVMAAARLRQLNGGRRGGGARA